MSTLQDNWTAKECEGALEMMEALQVRMDEAVMALKWSMVMDEVGMSMVHGRAFMRVNGD